MENKRLILQTVTTTKMLQLTLHKDALNEHFEQNANKLSQIYVSLKVTLHRPHSLI